MYLQFVRDATAVKSPLLAVQQLRCKVLVKTR
jgi:hypothetical protein